MTTEPSLLGRASPFFFQNHWGTWRLSTKKWDSQRDCQRQREWPSYSFALRLISVLLHVWWTSECSWKKKMYSCLPSTAGMLQWVLVWIEKVHLPLSWDLHCVLLLLGTGSGLMEENFNMTALSSSWRSADPRWNWNKMSQVWVSEVHPVFSANAYLTEKLPTIAVKCAVLRLAEAVAATLCKHTLPRQQLQ